MLGLPRFPLSLALAGLPGDAALRARAEWAAARGYRALQLNAASPETRPRDQSRSARRDLAATLRRHELSCSGVDLWIPPAHYLAPSGADRAADAAGAAITFAADLASLTGGRPVVCVTLPREDAAAGIVAALAERARAEGAWLADASWPARWAALGVAQCIDPATIFLSAEAPVSPAKALTGAGAAAVCARLSDLSPAGRVEPGTGRLDLLAFLAAITTVPSAGAPIVDLRGVPDPDRVATDIVARCGEARPG